MNMPKRKTRFALFLVASLCHLGTAAKLVAAEEKERQFSDWSEPVNLGPVLNSQGRDFNNQHPAISKNGLSLYFVSNRPGGFGNNDIWVSQRRRIHAPWGHRKTSVRRSTLHPTILLPT
jgi:hypothetical protein